LAAVLGVPVSSVSGWVGGEHGDAAIALWSTVKISGQPLDDYLACNNKVLAKGDVETYVKSVSKQIIDGIGGTEFGPAASFRDITRAIIQDTGDVLPVATPMRFEGIAEPVFVGVPVHLGSIIGENLLASLTIYERQGLGEAAKAIYQTYQGAIEDL
jgi:malate dehydrogenase